MNNDFLINLINEFNSNEQLTPNLIPDIPLYMDQITTIFNDKLSCYKRSDSDKLLTKTMINNYTKDGLIPPPEKKKYSKQHILTLISIYHLKGILSISDIKFLLSSLDKEKYEEIYSALLLLEKSEGQKVSRDYEVLEEIISELSEKDEKKAMLITALGLAVQANYRKLLAEKIIDLIKDDNE